MIASRWRWLVPTGARNLRVATIAGLEVRTQLTGPLFAALLALLVAAATTLNPLAMIPGARQSDAAVPAIANSVYALAPTFAMSGFFVYPFFVAMMAGLSVLRDEEAGVSELLRSTPLTTAEYVWSKYAGVLGALLVAVVAHVGIVMAVRELGLGGAALGAFSLSSYVTAAVWFAVPGMLWCLGIAFAIGARTRAPMAVYAVPVVLFVAEFTLLWNWHPADIDPRLDALLMVLDPTGLRWLTFGLFGGDHGVAFYNAAPLAIDRVLIASRLTTLLVPLACVTLVARSPRTRFTRRWLAGTWLMASWLRRTRVRVTMAATGVPLTRGLAGLHMARRIPSFVGAARTVMTGELRELVRRPSGYLFAVLLLAVVAETGGAEVDDFGSTAVLTAGGIAVNALPAVTVLMCLFLLFVIVESLQRDRATGFEALALSTPISTSAFIAGKAFAAGVLVAVLTLLCVLAGALMLWAQSGLGVTLWPLLLVFVAVLGPTFVLWIGFVTAVMSLARSRPTALAAGFVALLLTAAQFLRGSMTWVTNWPLLGALRWTEFAVFPLDSQALLLNRLTALAVAVLLFGLARATFVRTERDAAAAKRRRTPARMRSLAMRTVPLLALPVLIGGFLAVRIQQGTVSESTRLAGGSAHTSATAAIRHAQLAVTLEPARGAMRVAGSYTMANVAGSAVEQLSFAVPRAFGTVEWWIDGRSVVARVLAAHHVLALSSALAPGDSTRVSFRYEAIIARGFSRNGGAVSSFIMPSGVLLSTHRGVFLPAPGDAPSPAPSVRPTSATDEATDIDDAPSFLFNGGMPFTAEMQVTAPRDLVVNGVGERIREHTNAGWTTVLWSTRVPVSALNLVGGPYSVARRDGVAVYHLPAHALSADTILSTLVAARQRYSSWFAPFPWTELRLSEFADLATQATSYPTNIAFSEGIGFLTTSGTNGGLAFAVTAHEAAHQWWGHLVAVGQGPGTGMLVEGMADYSTLLLYESQLGRDARRSYATLLERQYLDGRIRNQERPVLETSENTASDEAVLQKKGAWAMWMLHNALGADRTLAGLRHFIAMHRAERGFATPAAMLQALRAFALDSSAYDAMIAQWFHSTALPEFSVRNVSCLVIGDGWECRATLRNIGTGHATVEVVAMRADSVLAGGRAQVTVLGGEEEALRWRLTAQPDRLVVDPEVVVLQLGRERASVSVR